MIESGTAKLRQLCKTFLQSTRGKKKKILAIFLFEENPQLTTKKTTLFIGYFSDLQFRTEIFTTTQISVVIIPVAMRE